MRPFHPNQRKLIFNTDRPSKDSLSLDNGVANNKIKINKDLRS